jgi:chorismate-pyruvate lyase
MLPVFTRPLGVMKETFSVESTVKARIASATLLAVDALGRVLETTPLERDDEGTAEAVAFVRTKSAHDFRGARAVSAGVSS